MAEPVELNPVINNVRAIRRLYKETPQPPTPSPTDSDLGIEFGESEVSTGRPFRKGQKRSLIHADSKIALGLTPLPEGSNENTPSPHSARPSAIPWSRSSSYFTIPRKTSLPLTAFVDNEDLEAVEEGGSPIDRPPSRPFPRSPICSFTKDGAKIVDLEASSDPSSDPSTSTSTATSTAASTPTEVSEVASDISPGPSNEPSTESSRLTSGESSTVPSPDHSPCKMARRDREVEPGYQPLEEDKSEPVSPFKRPANITDDSRPSSSTSSSSSSSSSTSTSTSSSSLALSSSSSSSAAIPVEVPLSKPKADSDSGGNSPARRSSVPSGRAERPVGFHPTDHSSSEDDDDDEDDSTRALTDEVGDDFSIINDPFKVCWIDNFIADEQYLDELVNFVKNGQYVLRESDLFTNRQMVDEVFMSNPLTERFLTTLVTKMIPFLSHLINRKLDTQKVTISASKYIYTDHLLCHDDLSGDRKIAFIYYLNKGWQRTFGGTLDLYRRDHVNDPTQITASLVPEFNKFLFFEVTDFSYHQVAEVVEKHAERYTINGWFHYKKTARRRSLYEPGLYHIRPGDIEFSEIHFERNLNVRYLGNKYEKEKRGNFETTGHLFIMGLFEKSFYAKFTDELRKCTSWVEVGPPNRRKYDVLPAEAVTPWLKEACKTLLCEHFYKYVWRYCGGRYHPEAYRSTEPPKHPKVKFIGSLPVESTSSGSKGGSPKRIPGKPDPRCCIAIRRWKKGYYATALDDDTSLTTLQGKVTDLVIFFGHTRASDPPDGGKTFYVKRNTGAIDFSFHPCGRDNTMYLNEIKKDEFHYVKYINCKSEGVFYDISMVFKE